jgi:hypothetical protein
MTDEGCDCPQSFISYCHHLFVIQGETSSPPRDFAPYNRMQVRGGYCIFYFIMRTTELDF